MDYAHSATVIGLLAGLTACANTKLTRSGFLAERESLQPAPEHELYWIPDDVEVFIADDVDLSGISRLVIQPVVFEFSEVGQDSLPSLEDQEYLAEQFESALRDELGDLFALAPEEGEDTLLVRAAITDVDGELVWLNTIGLILIVSPDTGGISCELEVIESRTGNRVFAMAAKRDGTLLLMLEAFHKWGHAKHGMKKWAKLLRSELADLKSKSQCVPSSDS